MSKTLNMLSISEIADLLKNGKIGVIPTDTVYGVVASASNPEAISHLYSAKHRQGNPGTIIAANIEQLVDLGIKRAYLKAVEQFWPNPISVIIPVGFEHEELHQGKMSVACRIPNKPELIALLEKTGPLVTSSANITGEATAVTLDEAQQYFGDEVDFYVDGGDLTGQKASTIIRMVDDAVEIIRQGAIQITEQGEIIS